MKRRIVPLLLALALVLLATACVQAPTTTAATTTAATTKATTKATTTQPTTEATTTVFQVQIPDYLNTDSLLPIIKEGKGSDITLKVSIIQPANGGTWDSLWVAQYIKNFMKLNFSVEQILDSAWGERKSLLFASGDLPDILLYMSLTTTDLVTYGQINKQLLAIEDYIVPELTPDIIYWFDKRPDLKPNCITPDGHMYTLPMIYTNSDPGGVNRIFINQKWLEGVGLQTPTTLDDFLTMAREFKAKDPAGVGVDNVIPLGCGIDYLNLGYYFLNSMGYVQRPSSGNSYDSYGLNPAIRNGECELPCGNEELFLEYLKIMKQCYDEGLFSKDFFTMTDVIANAQLKNGFIGVYGVPVYTTGLETWADWFAVKPLTSKWNNKPVWDSPAGVAVGGIAFSAATKYPELCLRFANYYFSENSRIMWTGPKDGSPEAMGLKGVFDCVMSNTYPDGITDLWTYLMQKVTPMPQFGSFEMASNAWFEYLGHPEFMAPEKRPYDLTIADDQYRYAVDQNLMPYIVDTFPTIYYLSEETANKMSDLNAVISPFVKVQVALFIRGDRSLDDFAGYMRQLKSIGFDEYQQIYKDVWASYLAAKEQK
jgi:putative aldouronate transport system substrate-binding protein